MLTIIKGSPLEEHFVAVNRSALLRGVRSIVGDADAEDVVQDTFEKAWKAANVRPSSDLRPWLRKIARNTAITMLGSRRSIDLTSLPEAVDESAEASVLRLERFGELQLALRDLPPAQRRTLVLHDFAGYSSHEIATLDAIPYHTVRTRLFRARRAMRAALSTQAA
ncbi:MAG TPA: RNA polymerase sigma factor [Candidatus Acidoferrum sp.]|nr:RNA polymerase sigma factor [Candidatus Acidoferrum sp.]